MADQPPKTTSPESGDDESAADSMRDSFEWTTEPEKSLLFNMIRLKPSGPCLQSLCDNSYCFNLVKNGFIYWFSWIMFFFVVNYFKNVPYFFFILNCATDTIGYTESLIMKYECD